MLSTYWLSKDKKALLNVNELKKLTYYDVHSRSWTKIYLCGVFFMIEYDKFYFKFKVFQEYLNGLKIKVRIKTSKACLLKIVEDKPLKYYTKLYFLWFSINF